MYKGLRRLERDDVVGWLPCPSLFHPGREVWVPAQMLFVGYKPSREHDEVAFCPAFSTGTAAHTSLAQALQNALLEFIEIDALMLHWYTKRAAPSLIVDNLTVASMYPGLFSADSPYDVLALDLSATLPVEAHVIATALVNRKDERPLIVLGAQGHLDPASAFYRSLMEAMAIAFLGIYGPLYLPEQYFASRSGSDFTDLDRNVSFFASPEDGERKRAVLRELVCGTKVLSSLKSYDSGGNADDTAKLVRQLSSVSEYGVYLDVTPPEARPFGWYVMRVFFPELVTMCVPGVPYGAHPRFEAFGGIRNEYPHPLP
jgi:thiazole/oxazole-forming peptide maturase SagD family component